MRRLNWTKVQPSEESIWKEVVTRLDSDAKTSIDYAALESLFGQTEKTSADASDSVGSTPLPTKKKDSLIAFMDPKKSMNLNITLKAFKGTTEDVVAIIRNGDATKVDIDHLRSLFKVLPDKEEVDQAVEHEADASRLAPAEQFCLALSRVPMYSLRVSAMIQTGEVGPTVARLRPQLEGLLTAADVIHTSDSVKLFFAQVLALGNFINSGSYAGNAAGFSLATLARVWETRANEAGLTLLHHIVATCSQQPADLLAFTSQLACLQDVIGLSVEALAAEVQAQVAAVALTASQLQAAPPDVANTFIEPVTSCSMQLADLQQLVEQLEQRRLLLANYFSENEKKFRLEDCFAIFHNLCCKIADARKELERRAELKAKQLRHQQYQEERNKELERRQSLRQLADASSPRHPERRSRQADVKRQQEADSERLADVELRHKKRRVRKPGYLTSGADDACLLDQLLADISKANYTLRGSL
ncbi:inverted formin-2 [Hyalella azteca]|uniref:Inverted formin-2 n=1 Tax=Hyalella azteca TaxID=294128 RepID=A0A8B7NMX9_HYAAZ|nr:inverted formin-2 [Hyalella azteca]